MSRFSRISSAIAGAVALVTGSVASVPQARAQATEPYLGQLMLVGFGFCPNGWARAEGQLMPISAYNALFSLLGTTYGGDGRTTFALPDLRGRAPIHVGQAPGFTNYSWGQKGGTESFTMTLSQMPSHNHQLLSTNEVGIYPGPRGKVIARNETTNNFNMPPVTNAMDPASIDHTGGGQPVFKRSPYLAMYWCIATVGLYPSRP